MYRLPSTLQKYFDIAVAMNTFPIGEIITIQELADKAGVHWKTAKKALIFFYFLNEINLPNIEYIHRVKSKEHLPKMILRRGK